jgi:hypothetical protein
MEHHILGLTNKGKTKFLLELFSDWVDESNRKKCKTFSKEQADYLIPLLKSENNNFVFIGSFPVNLDWKGRDNKLY